MYNFGTMTTITIFFSLVPRITSDPKVRIPLTGVSNLDSCSLLNFGLNMALDSSISYCVQFLLKFVYFDLL